jgi:hypothetical protein
MEFYSALKKNEILSFAGKWMEVQNIILSEVSQAQNTKNHVFSLICEFLDLGQMYQCGGLRPHDKGRAHTGDIEIGRKPQI